jgi:GDSL-like Lipase/Acylhydrolase
MNMKNIITILAVTFLLFFIACEDGSDLTEPSVINTGDADFSSFVTIGNSLTAGYQNASLYESSQEYSIGKIIADHVGTSFEQPIISNPGIPGKLELRDLTPTIMPNTGEGEATNTNYAAPYNNLGVSGAILSDLIDETDFATKSVYRENPYFQIVLRDQAHGESIIKQALNLEPTFINLWIGNNDVLRYATTGGTEGTDDATGTLPTDKPTFELLYNRIAATLTDTSGHRKICALNIPDVQNIPFFTTVGPLLASNFEAMGVQAIVYQSTQTGIGYGEASKFDLLSGDVLLTLTGIVAIDFLGDTNGAYYAINNMDVPPGVIIDSAFGFSPYNPWPDEFILDPAEINIAAVATEELNSVISSTVNANSDTWVLVDINSFFDDIADGGMVIDGINFNTSFILGNTFSLDGVHPTTRGYAVVANQIINEVNTKFNATIPRLNVSTFPASIDLNN